MTAKIYFESGEMGIFAQVRCFACNQLGLIHEKLSWIHSVRELFARITGFHSFTDLVAIKKLSVVVVGFRVFTVFRFRFVLGVMIVCLFEFLEFVAIFRYGNDADTTIFYLLRRF